MDKKERFEKAFNYLKYKGIIKTQEDVAQTMGATRANVSSALSGNPKVLTDSFLSRFVRAFPGVFSSEWLIDGVGEMLLTGNDAGNLHISESSNGKMVNETIEALKKQIAILEKRIEDKDTLLRMKDKFINILEYQLDMSKRDSSFHNQPASLMASDPMLEPEK